MESTNHNLDTNTDLNNSLNHKEKTIEICITMPTQAYFLSGIRDFTLNLIKNMTKFSEQWAFRFQSIVDELCNNAIEHGSREGEQIKIIFQNNPKEYIQIYVEDSGTGPEHILAQDLAKLVEDRKKQTGPNYLIRGRGLPKIVSEWTDELEFMDNEKGGITVRIKKLINNPLIETQTSGGLNQQGHITLN